MAWMWNRCTSLQELFTFPKFTLLFFLQFHPQIEINLVPDSVKDHFPIVKMFAWQFFLSFKSLKVWIFQTKISIPLYTLQFECQLIIFTQK